MKIQNLNANCNLFCNNIQKTKSQSASTKVDFQRNGNISNILDLMANNNKLQLNQVAFKGSDSYKAENQEKIQNRVISFLEENEEYTYKGEFNKALHDAVTSLKPETIDAIKDDTLLFSLMVNNSCVPMLYPGVSEESINVQDRLNKINLLEKTFTTDEIEELTTQSNDLKHNRRKALFIRWLLKNNGELDADIASCAKNTNYENGEPEAMFYRDRRGLIRYVDFNKDDINAGTARNSESKEKTGDKHHSHHHHHHHHHHRSIFSKIAHEIIEIFR